MAEPKHRIPAITPAPRTAGTVPSVVTPPPTTVSALSVPVPKQRLTYQQWDQLSRQRGISLHQMPKPARDMFTTDKEYRTATGVWSGTRRMAQRSELRIKRIERTAGKRPEDTKDFYYKPRYEDGKYRWEKQRHAKGGLYSTDPATGERVRYKKVSLGERQVYTKEGIKTVYTSPAVEPGMEKYISGTSKTGYNVDVAGAVKAGRVEGLKKLGFRGEDIEKAKVTVEQQKRWESKHLLLADGRWILIDQWNKLPEKYQRIGLRQGYTAMSTIIGADQARYTRLVADLEPFRREVGALEPGEYGPKVPESLRWRYDLPAALRKGIKPALLQEMFPLEVVKAAADFNRKMEHAAKVEELYQAQTWVHVRTGKIITDAEHTALGTGLERDEYVKDLPALILPADPRWQILKDRPKSDPERQAFVRRWQDKAIDTASFATLAAMPYTMGGIGAIGKLLTIPKVGSLALRVTGAVVNPIVRSGVHLAKLTNLWPAVLGVSRLADDMRTTQLQGDWQKFDKLPTHTKNEWADKAGYPANYDKLTDEQKAVVLIHYSTPPEVSRQAWLNTVGEKLEEMNSYASEKTGQLSRGSPAPISLPITLLGGVAVGVLEGIGYVASIPMLASNLAAGTITGTAGATAVTTVRGMAEFFTVVLPQAFRANPALATGRVTGLFLLSPAAVLKLSKSGLARFSPRYVPERGMAMEYSTVRVRFDKASELAALPPTERMRLVEKAIGDLLAGKKSVKIKGASVTIEVKNVPYQQVVGNSLWHFTPDMRPFNKGQVPVKGRIFFSPQAALRFGVVNTKGRLGKNAGLVEIRVPDKHRPKMVKLLRRGEAELESVFGKDTVLDPIPGWTGKGVSANVITGPYPIRRFTVLGSSTTVAKLTPLVLMKIRALSLKASMGDLIKGWSGRAESLKGVVKVDPRIGRIDAGISALAKSKPELLAGTGEIVSPRQSILHPSGRGRIKPRVTAVVRNSKGGVMLVKDVTEQSFGLPGGQVATKWKRGQLGFRTLADGRHVLTPEGAAHGQVKSETGIGLDQTRYLGTYLGKINEYALSGSRIFEAKAKTDIFKLKRSEISDAIWWNGKSEITVYPATYDILSGLAKRYGLDMSKVRIDNSIGVLNRARDTKIAQRISKGRVLPKTLNPAKLDKIEIAILRRERFDISRGRPPELIDWLTAEGELQTVAELLLGGRRATTIKANKPLRERVDAALLAELRKDTNSKAVKAKQLLEQGKTSEAVRMYEADMSAGSRRKFLEKLRRRIEKEAQAKMEDIYTRYGDEIYRPELLSRRYTHWLSRYTAAALANRPLGMVRRETTTQLRELRKVVAETAELDRPTPIRPVAPTEPLPRVPPPDRPDRPPPPPPPPLPPPPRQDEPPPRRPPPEKPPPPSPSPPPTVTRLQTRSPMSQPIPEGSIAWRQGWTWKYIAPPWTAKKPTSLRRGAIPMGAVRTDLRTPQETVQMVGRSRKARVPQSLSVDLGIADIFVTNAGRTIHYKGKGEQSNVGSSIDSATQGMSIPADRFLVELESGLVSGRPVSGTPSSVGVNRARMSKKRPPRKVGSSRGDNGYGYTSIRGVRI